MEMFSKEIDDYPLTYDDFVIKKKVKQKWLGSQLHEGGPAASHLATVEERRGRTTGAIFELKSCLEDIRLNSVGGISAGLQIYEMSIIPMLLNNGGTWTGVGEDTVNELEKLQTLFLSVLLAVPLSVPRPALGWETKSVGMIHRLNKMKLNLAYHIKTLDEGDLANQVLEEQIKYEWPGLASEVRELCKELEIDNIMDEKPTVSKASWKNTVNKAVHKQNEKELRQSIENYSKLDDLQGDKHWEIKDYLKTLTMSEARVNFSLRAKMFPCKLNYSSDPKNSSELWKCDSCTSSIDSQSHILWCPAYSKLREGKTLDNNRDVIRYFQKVLQIRS